MLRRGTETFPKTSMFKQQTSILFTAILAFSIPLLSKSICAWTIISINEIYERLVTRFQTITYSMIPAEKESIKPSSLGDGGYTKTTKAPPSVAARADIVVRKTAR